MMADNKDEWIEPNTAKKASLLLQMIHSFHITSYIVSAQKHSFDMKMYSFDSSKSQFTSEG